MKFRFAKTLVSLVALTLLGSCTTRYQDLLRDRDTEIRNLNGRVSALSAEKDDLERQLANQRDAARTGSNGGAARKQSERQIVDAVGLYGSGCFRIRFRRRLFSRQKILAVPERQHASLVTDSVKRATGSSS